MVVEMTRSGKKRGITKRKRERGREGKEGRKRRSEKLSSSSLPLALLPEGTTSTTDGGIWGER
jgi:hypothetical protein